MGASVAYAGHSNPGTTVPADPAVTKVAQPSLMGLNACPIGEHQPQQRQPDRILLADDDPLCLALARNALEKGGYEVATTATGAETLEAIGRFSPALVVLDLELPDMSGFEVCRRIKADALHTDIPIIFLTIASDPQVKAEAFKVGGADYVTKPIEQLELLARIKSHLELAASRQALKSKATLFETVATEQMTRLEQVRNGQTSMLTAPSAFQDLQVAVRFVTANEAGGDFYEISRLSDELFGVLVTDVAGHDLSVPFITGALKGLVGLCLNEALSPRESMIMLNTGLLRVLAAASYVSGCYAKIDRELMAVEIISAGHPPALLQRRDGEVEYVDAVGDVLGMYEQVLFDTSRLEVRPGDRLFMYTDGLIEGCLDESGRPGHPLYGMKRLKERVQELRVMPISTVVDYIVDELIAENGGSVCDDVVLLGIEF